MKNILKKIIVLLSFGFVLFGFNFVFAEDTPPTPPICTAPQILNGAGDTCIDPEVLVCTAPQVLNEIGDLCIDPIIEPTPDPTLENIVKDIVVKNGCTVKDIEGVDHIFPKEDSVSEFLGVCAIVSAKELGYINDFELTNDSSFGLYLSSINSEKPSSTEYWALFLNDEYASCGIECLPVLVDDTLSFILSDWMTGTESTKISFKISSLEDITSDPIPENTSGGGGGSITPEKTFSVSNALDFLFQNKESASMFVHDWIAISAGAGDNSDLKLSLVDYLKSNPVDSTIITDNERRAMALMALGINPYNGTEVDYIKKITDSFNGTQFDDNSASDINDDIFALIVLQNVGYDKSEEIIQKTISYILERQVSGSWGSVDMTAVGIMALKDFEDVLEVSDAISKAENYLIESQNEDGGFDNSASTSWAIQALSLNNSYDDKVDDAIKYLADKQQDDGGVDGDGLDNRVWNTSYAVPAVLKLSWNDILEDFEKVEVEEENNSFQSGSNRNTENKEDEKQIVVIPEIKMEEPVISFEEIKVTPIVPVKIVKVQNEKENFIKSEIKTEVLQKEELNNNLLVASVGNFEQIDTKNTFLSSVHKILQKISHPFVWLWIHLGF